jgi:hypothetical protein
LWLISLNEVSVVGSEEVEFKHNIAITVVNADGVGRLCRCKSVEESGEEQNAEQKTAYENGTSERTRQTETTCPPPPCLN